MPWANLWVDGGGPPLCPMCKPGVGRLFRMGFELPLPAHPHCDCYYVLVFADDKDLRWFGWAGQPDEFRQRWVYEAARMLCRGESLPPGLEPLRREARAYAVSRADDWVCVWDFHLMEDENMVNVSDDLALDGDREASAGALPADGLSPQRVSLVTQIDELQPGRVDLGSADPLALADYSVVLITAGTVRRMGGGFARWAIPADVLEAAVPLFEGAACFVDHPGWLDNNHSVTRLGGVITRATWDAAIPVRGVDPGEADHTRPGIMAVLRLFDTEMGRWSKEVIDAVIGVKPRANVGLSATLWQIAEWDDEAEMRLTQEITKVDSVDLVFQTGANGDIFEELQPIFEAKPKPLGGKGDVIMPEELEQASAELNAEEAARTEAVEARTEAEAEAREEVQGAVVAQLAAQPTVPAQPMANDQPAALSPDVLRDMVRNELGRLFESQTIEGLGQPPTAQPHISGQTGLDRFSPAVDWMFGVEGAAVPDPQFRRSDRIYEALTGDYEWRGIFQPDRVMLATADTTTLADLATDAMNKVVMAQFSRLSFWRWYELVATVAPNDGSLNDMKWITVGGTGNLPVVGEGGSYTEGTIGDGKEADAFNTRGKYVGITRRMLKNSEIARIQAVPRALAVDAVRTRSAIVSALFTDASGVGPTLDDDSVVLFHADHNNIATTALGTTTAAWVTASAECFAHTERGSSKAIGTFAKYLLVPDDLYFTGLSNFGYGDGNPTTYNPFASAERSQDDPRPVVLAVPDWTDANDWAYVADPAIWPVIMMSYSQLPGGGSHPLPEIFAALSETAGLMFTNDTLPIKVRDEYAVGVNGAAGIGKRNVA